MSGEQNEEVMQTTSAGETVIKESTEAAAIAAEKAEPVVTESMEDYAKELEASFQTVEEGDILTGTVIDISETEIILDLKYYAEGIIRVEDYSADPNCDICAELSVGDEITATVIRKDDGNGNILLSKKEANEVLAWDKLKELMQNETNVTVKVSEIVKGGAVAFLEGIRGFIPASRLSLSYAENLDEFLNKELTVRVIEVKEEDRKLILSAREILREQDVLEKSKQISNVEVGLVTEGTVESLMPYGAFIRLGNGLTGLVHISQICEKRIKHPNVILKEGDSVKVKVIAVKDGKLSLSMKALQDVAAEEITEETIDLPETEAIGTSLGDLFKNIKF